MLQAIKNFARTKIRELIIEGDVDLEAWRAGAFMPSAIYRYYNSSSKLTNPYKQVPSIYSSARFFADTMAAVPLQVFEGNYKSEDGKRPVSDNNRWARLFDKLNPMFSSSEMIALWTLHMILTGRAYWRCIDESGRPCEPKDAVEFWPEHPARVECLVDKRTGIISKYKIKSTLESGKYTVIDADFMLSWREIDPDDIYGATSRIEAISKGAETELNAKNTNGELLKNALGHGGIFSSPDWKFPNQRKQAEQALREAYEGPTRMWRALFLPGNITHTKPDFKLREMQFKEILEYQSGENRTCIGVPAALLTPNAEVPFASLFGILQQFCHLSVKPMMRKFKDTVWMRLFSHVEGGRMWVDFDITEIPAFQEDYKSSAEAGVKLKELGVSVQDIKTLLRIRIPDREYHQTPIVNSAMVPITAVLEGKTIPSQNQPASAPGAQNQPAAATNPDAARVNPDVSPTKGFVKTIEISWDWAPFANIEANVKSGFENYFNDQRVECERRFFDVTGGRKSRNTANIIVRALTPDEINSILFAEDEWNKRIVNDMNPHWLASFDLTEKILKQKLGSLDLWKEKSPAELERIRQAAADRIVGINEDTRTRLRETLIEGSAANETISQLQSRINAIFNNSKGARSLAIARTEVGGAASETRHAVVSAEGAEEKEWMTAGDENVSHGEVTGNTQNRNHAALNGEVRKIDERYSNGLMTPLEVSAPARETVNCRCTERYKFKKKE